MFVSHLVTVCLKCINFCGHALIDFVLRNYYPLFLSSLSTCIYLLIHKRIRIFLLFNIIVSWGSSRGQIAQECPMATKCGRKNP